MHPERSPYACFGPELARAGQLIPNFLRNPIFRPGTIAAANLDDPLAWRDDGGRACLRGVKRLARALGYE